LIISLIVAIDEKGGIGKNNQLPWHLPSDLKRFKQLTMGHCVVMGRKTFETIGKPLPGRKMIVITSQKDYTADGCQVLHSLDEAIKHAKDSGESELFIIGGGEIFKLAINWAERIYLTTVHTSVDADVYFPAILPAQWEQVSLVNDIGSDEDYRSDFRVLERKH
jgi:dihydrofolate reductase